MWVTAKTRPDSRASFAELLGLAPRRRQRLVADHVDAGLEEGSGGCRMDVVGRDDGDRLDAVLRPALASRHLVEVVVAAVRLQQQVLARTAATRSGSDDSAPATSS